MFGVRSLEASLQLQGLQTGGMHVWSGDVETKAGDMVGRICKDVRMFAHSSRNKLVP